MQLYGALSKARAERFAEGYFATNRSERECYCGLAFQEIYTTTAT